MTTKPSVTFNCKKAFTNPCKKFIQLFKFKLKKPIFIKTLRFRKQKPTTTTSKTHHFSCLKPLFKSSRKTSREMDRVMELKSFSDAGYMQKAPCPSPLTPAYIKMRRETQSRSEEDVEEACRSFENYLVEMIAVEGKMRDLVDVEELLYCWNSLKNPVFVNLVCRFYGELCNDLFSSNVVDDDDDIRSLM